MSGRNIRLGQVTFDDAEGELTYDTDGELTLAMRPLECGGSDDGKFFIRLNVDGTEGAQVFTELGQTGDLAAIEAAMIGLQRLHANLSDLLGVHARAGRCLDHGDWGRCRSEHAHSGEHDFLTEAQGMADIERSVARQR